MYAAIGVVTLPAGLCSRWLVPLLVETPDDLVWPARISTFLVVARLAARFPLGLFTNLLVAQQRFDVQNLANASRRRSTPLLVVVLVPNGGGLILLGALTLLTTLLRLASPLVWVRRELPGLRLRREYVTRDGVRELTAFSWSMFLLHVANKVVFSTDVVVVGIVLGPVAATFYAIPAKLFTLAFGLSSAATNLIFPAFAEYEGAGETERAAAVAARWAARRIAAAALLALPLLLMPDQLVHAWVGDGYADSTWVHVGLAVVVLRPPAADLLTQYLTARGLPQPLARTLIVVVAVNVVLSVVLAVGGRHLGRRGRDARHGRGRARCTRYRAWPRPRPGCPRARCCGAIAPAVASLPLPVAAVVLVGVARLGGLGHDARPAAGRRAVGGRGRTRGHAVRARAGRTAGAPPLAARRRGAPTPAAGSG